MYIYWEFLSSHLLHIYWAQLGRKDNFSIAFMWYAALADLKALSEIKQVGCVYTRVL